MRGIMRDFIIRVIPLLLFPYFVSGVDFDLDKLISDANSTQKPILLFLHKDNCRFCEKMIFNLEDENISKTIQEKFILVDINRDDNETISFRDYNGSTRGFLKRLGVNLYPTIIFLDGNGKFIHHIIGYRNKKIFRDILEYIYTKKYKQVTFEEFEDELQTNKRK